MLNSFCGQPAKYFVGELQISDMFELQMSFGVSCTQSERYNTSEEDNALKQKPFQTFSMDRLWSTGVVNEGRF